MRNETLYLHDILRAIDSIQTFVEGMDLETFQADDKTSSAVTRKFEIMGEAAKHVSDDIRQQFPDVPWKQMAGMRDRLIHFYFGVDALIVWRTIQEHLPTLRQSIQNILDEQT